MRVIHTIPMAQISAGYGPERSVACHIVMKKGRDRLEYTSLYFVLLGLIDQYRRHLKKKNPYPL